MTPQIIQAEAPSITNGRSELLLGMSNLGPKIDAGLIEALRSDPTVYAQYSGWNFCAYVCVEADAAEITCEVWTHRALTETLHATTLEEVMRLVCDRYGKE